MRAIPPQYRAFFFEIILFLENQKFISSNKSIKVRNLKICLYLSIIKQFVKNAKY